MSRFSYAVAALLALAQSPVVATTLVDGGFEAKGAALPVTAYCYDNQNAGNGFCASSPWVNLGSNTGVIRSGNGAWGSVNAAEGIYYGFIQVAGVLAQSFVATSNGTGTLSWIDTNRNGQGLQSYNVSISDGVGTVALGSFNTTIGPWVSRTSSMFALTSGTTYTLRFTGLATNDATSFIDNVALSATSVPEPERWALMIAGMGVTGTVMRRRHHHRRVVAA